MPWGDGFNTKGGDTVTFQYVKGDSGWTSTLEKAGTSTSVNNTFALANKSFNWILFDIELYNESWDFGPLVFSNITIEATGTDTTWCTGGPQNNSAFDFEIGSIGVRTANQAVICGIDSLTLKSPSPSSSTSNCFSGSSK